MTVLHTELEAARREVEERNEELTRVQVEKVQREQELQMKLQEQLLIKSELHAEHDENDEPDEEENRNEYGEGGASEMVFVFIFCVISLDHLHLNVS